MCRRCSRLRLLQTMAPSLNAAAITETVLDTVVPMVDDPIPNIRFNVAKAFEVLASVLQQSDAGRSVVAARIVPGLEKLKEDSDADVRFFAMKALQAIEASNNGAAPTGQGMNA